MDALNLVAQIAAIVGALTLIAAASFEMFFYGRPFAQKFLHVETTNVDDVKLWAFCIGARNLIAAAGTIIGLIVMWTGDVQVGVIIVLTASWYMLLSSLAMGVADLVGFWRPRGGSLMGVLASATPPLVVLVASLF